MKICFLADSIVLQQAGIKRYNLDLLHSISNYSNLRQLTVVVPERSVELSDYRQHTIPILKHIAHTQRVRQFTSIPRYINASDFDIVIEPAHFGPFRIKSSTKSITVIHDLTPITHSELHPKSSSISHKVFMPSILKRGDLILTNSFATQAVIERKYGVESHVLYPNIPQATAGQSNKNENEQYILAIGTLEPRKDYITLIKAFEQFLEKHPQCRLKIIGGDGWKNQALEKYLQNNSVSQNIDFLGYVSEEQKYKYLHSCTMLVSASIAEGFGLPNLEALACNKAVIASDIPPFKEVGGSAIRYFPVSDYSSLATQMLSVMHQQIVPETKGQLESLRESRKEQYKNLFNIFDSWR